MKKFKYSFVLAVLLSMVASIVSARDIEEKGIRYSIHFNASDGHYATIIPETKDVYGTYHSAYKGDIVIPEFVEREGVKYIVTEVGEGAFADRKEITSVILPRSIRHIRRLAFSNCKNITSIVIPEMEDDSDFYDPSYIGENAFANCVNLISINLPNRFTDIGKEAFKNCSNLTEITVGNQLIYVAEDAFNGCKTLEKAQIKTVKKAVEANKKVNAPAEIPGGILEFIRKNLQYPEICQEQNIQGRVNIQFIVDEEGTVTDVKVLRSPDEHLSAEALRMVNSMPKWKPAIKFGKAVKMKMTLPVMFRLS